MESLKNGTMTEQIMNQPIPVSNPLLPLYLCEGLAHRFWAFQEFS